MSWGDNPARSPALWRDHARSPRPRDQDRGRSISLTAIELAVMRELVKARGRPLSRAQLLDAAWGGELDVSERAVDT